MTKVRLDDFSGQLIQAAKEQDLHMVEALIAMGADVKHRDKEGATALHWAACKNAPDVARALIRVGADVDAQTDSQETPLHWAAVTGREALCRALLEAGAMVDGLDGPNGSGDWTPLKAAVDKKQQRNALILIAHGATANVEDVAMNGMPELLGMPALHACIHLDDTDQALKLLKAGANIEVEHDGMSALDLESLVNSANPQSDMSALLQSWQARQSIDRICGEGAESVRVVARKSGS